MLIERRAARILQPHTACALASRAHARARAASRVLQGSCRARRLQRAFGQERRARESAGRVLQAALRRAVCGAGNCNPLVQAVLRSSLVYSTERGLEAVPHGTVADTKARLSLSAVSAAMSPRMSPRPHAPPVPSPRSRPSRECRTPRTEETGRGGTGGAMAGGGGEGSSGGELDPDLLVRGASGCGGSCVGSEFSYSDLVQPRAPVQTIDGFLLR